MSCSPPPPTPPGDLWTKNEPSSLIYSVNIFCYRLFTHTVFTKFH